MPRVLLHLSGGDWYDAGVDYAEVPDDIDLVAERDKYNRCDKPGYFYDWLVLKYNLKTPQSNLLIIEDDTP
jgi:hypothetical protein